MKPSDWQGMHVVSDENFIAACSQWFLSYLQENSHGTTPLSIVLSGGSTPLAVYAQIIHQYASYQIDWGNCHFFWGDERYVPQDDEQNNAHKAIKSLLSFLQLKEKQYTRPKTNLSLEACADDYEEQIKHYFDTYGQNHFDLVLLGLGDDGHTLSLFPGHELPHDDKRRFIGTVDDEHYGKRITMLPSLVNESNQITFWINGEKKSKAAYQVLQNDFASKKEYPGKWIAPEKGRILYLMDTAAASGLDSCFSF